MYKGLRTNAYHGIHQSSKRPSLSPGINEAPHVFHPFMHPRPLDSNIILDQSVSIFYILSTQQTHICYLATGSTPTWVPRPGVSVPEYIEGRCGVDGQLKFRLHTKQATISPRENVCRYNPAVGHPCNSNQMSYPKPSERWTTYSPVSHVHRFSRRRALLQKFGVCDEGFVTVVVPSSMSL